MTTNHLLSTSLFNELFQQNIVSADGRIIATKKQLEDYYTFLVTQSKERTASLYQERKNMVNAVEDLLNLENRTSEQTKLLNRLLNELHLEFEEDGFLSVKKPKKSKQKYLGSVEPKMSLFEREIEAELRRVQVLKRDLKVLDDWLEQISNVSPMAESKELQTDWKEAGAKFRKRTSNRMRDMENARVKLIKEYYVDYERNLKRVLNPQSPTKGLDSKKKNVPHRAAHKSQPQKHDEPEYEDSKVSPPTDTEKENIDLNATDQEKPSVRASETENSKEKPDTEAQGTASYEAKPDTDAPKTDIGKIKPEDETPEIEHSDKRIDQEQETPENEGGSKVEMTVHSDEKLSTEEPDRVDDKEEPDNEVPETKSNEENAQKTASDEEEQVI